MKRLPFWGVTPELTPTFAKRIILTNYLGFLFAANMSLTAIALFYFEQYMLGAFTTFFVLTELSWPIFNLFGHYNVSRIGMLFSSNLLGFIVSVLLPETGYNHGFFVMAGLPILLFSLEEKKSIFLGLIMPLLLFPLSEWLQYETPNWGNVVELSSNSKIIIHMSIGIIYIILIFLMFLFLSRENERSEEKLKELHTQLEEQRARSFSSAKFAALGEMASGIAHEINNPMTVINMNTAQLKHLINGDFPKEKSFEKIDTITKTVGRVARIIDAMSIFSREAGGDSFENESLKKIFDDTLSLCTERFKHNNVILSVEPPPEDIIFKCRPVQISQVLLNLLNNSLDAIESCQEKWIRLEAFVDRSNDKIIISVTDSGNGIPEAKQEKIFQPFYTSKSVGRGTGLGLSLSKKMIEDHGGVLYLDMKHANTKFVIEFPHS